MAVKHAKFTSRVAPYEFFVLFVLILFLSTGVLPDAI